MLGQGIRAHLMSVLGIPLQCSLTLKVLCSTSKVRFHFKDIANRQVTDCTLQKVVLELIQKSPRSVSFYSTILQR